MGKLTPWTKLRRRLEPLVLELHAATSWRVLAPMTLEGWVRGQTWEELWWGDEVIEELCRANPPQGALPAYLLRGGEEGSPEERRRESAAAQVMHRMLYAMDLSREMPAIWRREFPLTGEFPADARMVLIHGWRSNAVLAWARRCGSLYVGWPDE